MPSDNSTPPFRDCVDSDAKFRRLFDSNIVAISIWQLNGRVQEANDAFLRIVGYERDDLVAGRLCWTEFAPARSLGRDREELLAQVQSTGSLQPLEWEFIRKDGIRVFVLVGAALLEGTDQGIAFALNLTARRRAEQALRDSEAYLRETQRLAHSGSWAYNHRTGVTTHYSDEAFRLFGLDPRRGYVPQLGEVMQRIHPEERERVAEELIQILREKAEYALDYRVVLGDGSVRDLRSIGHPVLAANGELLEYYGTVMDVTDRLRAERRLLLETQITRVLSAAASLEEATPKILQAVCESQRWHLSALWRIDRPLHVIRCAEIWWAPSVAAGEFAAATRASAFAPGSDLPGKVWASREPLCVQDVSQDADFSRASVAASLQFRGGMAFPILLGREVLGVIESFTLDPWQPDSDLLALMSVIGDQIGQFMKRTAADEELQLRVGMLQNIPVAAWSVTPDGTPDVVNRLWYEYTGQTAEYVNSHPNAWMTTIHPEDREGASQIYWEGIRSGRGFTMEARFLRASDGSYRWHLNRAVPVRDADGKLLRLVGTSTDVHDLRHVQEELRNTQAEFARITRVMTMGELAASIAHEVNQPLGAMVTSAASCARWLATEPPKMNKARRSLERIVKDGRRAGAIIERIRALMKRQAPRKEWLDVNETISEVIALTQYVMRQNRIVLETRLDRDLPRVLGDRVQCQQVLLNLIVNAVEAMSEVGLRRRELTIVSMADGPDAVRIEIRDSGAGVDPEHATQLFEPFYTTKAEGLGIGLSISRSIVEAHGGRLSAGPNKPYGAVFSVWMPVEERIS
jgi:PAS domain S-box-containing protein